jgi:hypothetical protein
VGILGGGGWRRCLGAEKRGGGERGAHRELQIRPPDV